MNSVCTMFMVVVSRSLWTTVAVRIIRQVNMSVQVLIRWKPAFLHEHSYRRAWSVRRSSWLFGTVDVQPWWHEDVIRLSVKHAVPDWRGKALYRSYMNDSLRIWITGKVCSNQTFNGLHHIRTPKMALTMIFLIRKDPHIRLVTCASLSHLGILTRRRC